MNSLTKTAAKIRFFLDSYSYAVTAIALATITFASLSPRGSSGDPGAVGIPDSIAHIVAYAVVIFFRAATPSANLVWPGFAVLVWSILIELLQPLVGRSANLHDVLANATGVIVGILIGYSLRRLLLRLSSQSA